MVVVHMHTLYVQHATCFMILIHAVLGVDIVICLIIWELWWLRSVEVEDVCRCFYNNVEGISLSDSYRYMHHRMDT